MLKDWFSRNVYLKVMGSESLFTISLCEISDNRAAAAMKLLIKNHKEEIEKFTRLDYNRIQKIKYLHEFDREVQ